MKLSPIFAVTLLLSGGPAAALLTAQDTPGGLTVANPLQSASAKDPVTKTDQSPASEPAEIAQAGDPHEITTGNVAKQDTKADPQPSAVKKTELETTEPAKLNLDRRNLHASRVVSATAPHGTSEFVRSRYPSGAIQIEREVRQDAGHNYFNHGSWKLWDLTGDMVASGSFSNGVADGQWERIYRGAEATNLLHEEQGEFELPLKATFNLVDGRVDGEWKISDAKDRPVRVWNFQDGLLHGEVAAWFASGSRIREAHYDQGVPTGLHREWSSEEKVLESNEFEYGRLLADQRTRYANGELESEGKYLYPRYRLTTNVDWWNGSVQMQAAQSPQGKAQKMGNWVHYYPAGIRAHAGEFLRGEPEGKHEWWYRNGQLRARGSFLAGEPHGKWVWWHQNGLQMASGHYVEGIRAGRWVDWDEKGTRIGLIDHSDVQPTTSQITPPSSQSEPTPVIERTKTEIPLTADASEHKHLQLRPAPDFH